MPKMSKRVRNALLGVMLVIMGYLGGQPSQVIQGVTTIMDVVSEDQTVPAEMN